jgi:hypothetical protein
MNMLITERAILNPQITARVRNVPQVVALPAPKAQPLETIQIPVVRRGLILQTLNALGDRQSWLLLGLILIPVAGAIHNFLTYGLIR